MRIYARDRWGIVQGSARPALQEIEDLGSGENECRLRLPVTGTYSVNVALGKAALQGSPLKVTIVTG